MVLKNVSEKQTRLRSDLGRETILGAENFSDSEAASNRSSKEQLMVVLASSTKNIAEQYLRTKLVRKRVELIVLIKGDRRRDWKIVTHHTGENGNTPENGIYVAYCRTAQFQVRCKIGKKPQLWIR